MTAKILIDIECPNCGCSKYISFGEDYDNELITLFCECLNCNTKFQINYRAVEIEKIKNEFKL
jgi:DNA-directed RNA polymerase subunit M/transcription elongation factor TFIIS